MTDESAPPTRSANINYILVDGPDEVRRLTTQYFFVKSFFDLPSLLPPPVDISTVRRALDAGAGTAVWALDLADAASNNNSEQNNIEIFACDISTAKFPPPSVLHSANITAFQHDLTLPLPPALQNTFDVVHVQFMTIAFTAPQWARALGNVADALVPGGYVVLTDSDLAFYSPSPESALPPDGVPIDVDAAMKGSEPAHAANALFLGHALRNDFVIGLSYRLPDLIPPSLSIVARDSRYMPTGRLAASTASSTSTGSNTGALALEMAHGLTSVFDLLSTHLLRAGALEAPVGNKIEDEAGRKAVVERIGGAVEEGVVCRVTTWVLRKAGGEE